MRPLASRERFLCRKRADDFMSKDCFLHVRRQVISHATNWLKHGRAVGHLGVISCLSV